MTQYLEGPTPLGKMSLNTLFVIAVPLMISIADPIAVVEQIIQWEWPSLQEWVDIACFHAAAAGMWLFGLWIVLMEWAEKSLEPHLNWWRRVLFSLVTAGIYLMGIALFIGGFGALIYIKVYA